MSLEQELSQGIHNLSIQHNTTIEKKLLHYIQLLIKWNRVFNLIATVDPNKILTHHILDSLAIYPYIDGNKILDVGTGAGFPGIPLAIIFPQKQFTLLDSVGKKINFLRQVKQELELNNVEIIQMRAEDFFPQTCFNNIVSRAVGKVDDMVNLTQHLLCPDGKLLLMKGKEIEKLKDSNWEYEIITLTVPKLNKQRHLIRLCRLG